MKVLAVIFFAAFVASTNSSSLLEMSQTLWSKLLEGGLTKIGALDPLRVPVVKVDQSEGNTSYRIILRSLEIIGLNSSSLESVHIGRGRLHTNLSEHEAGYVSYTDQRELDTIRYRFHTVVKEPKGEESRNLEVEPIDGSNSYQDQYGRMRSNDSSRSGANYQTSSSYQDNAQRGVPSGPRTSSRYQQDQRYAQGGQGAQGPQGIRFTYEPSRTPQQQSRYNGQSQSYRRDPESFQVEYQTPQRQGSSVSMTSSRYSNDQENVKSPGRVRIVYAERQRYPQENGQNVNQRTSNGAPDCVASCVYRRNQGNSGMRDNQRDGEQKNRQDEDIGVAASVNFESRKAYVDASVNPRRNQNEQQRYNQDGQVRNNQNGQQGYNQDGQVRYNQDGQVRYNQDGQVRNNQDGQQRYNQNGQVRYNQDGQVRNNQDGQVRNNQDGQIRYNQDGQVRYNENGQVRNNQDGQQRYNNGNTDENRYASTYDQKADEPNNQRQYHHRYQMGSSQTRIENQPGYVDIVYADDKDHKMRRFGNLRVESGRDTTVYSLDDVLRDLRDNKRFIVHNFTEGEALTKKNDAARIASETKRIKDMVRYARDFQEMQGFYEQGMQLVYHYGDQDNEEKVKDGMRTKRAHLDNKTEEDDIMHVIMRIRVPMLRVNAGYVLMGKVGKQVLRGNGLLNGNFTEVIGDFTLELKKVDEDTMVVRAARARLSAKDKKIRLQGMDEEGPVKEILTHGLLAAEAVAAMLADDLATKALSEKTADSIIYKMYKNLPAEN